MAHNPILKEIRPGRLARPEIGLNQLGVLFVNNRPQRILEPGDSLGIDERLWGKMLLYIVDCAPHDASWRVNLPAADESDSFSTTINLRYRVQDAQRMVEDQVKDTERLIGRTLEPDLRKITRPFRLSQYRRVESELENALNEDVFAKLGLDLLEVDVVLNLSDEDLRRVRQLEQLARAMRVAQQVEHTAELPSQEATYHFPARIIVSYRVLNDKLLPTATLEEAEAWLWRQVRAKLRRESRAFKVNQVAQAEWKLHEVLADSVFSDHGLEIESADVEIELDERALKHARELEAIRMQVEYEEAKAKLDKVQQDRDQNKSKRAIDFYAPYIEEGQWKLLAMNLANNKMDAREILDYLGEQELADRKLKSDLLTMFVEKDALGMEDLETAAKLLMAALANQGSSQVRLAAPKPQVEVAALGMDRESETASEETADSAADLDDEGENDQQNGEV